MRGFLIAIFFVLFLTACEKEASISTLLPKEQYGFNAIIGEKQVDLKYSSEEKLINGQYGFLGGIETYRVVVDLSNENINDLGRTELTFELYDLQEKLFKINSQDLYPTLWRKSDNTLSKAS